MKEDRKTIRFVVIIAVIGIGAIAAVMYTHPFGAPEEKINWNLTLIGTAEKVVTFDELKAMPSYEGYGGFFSTVGMINGPFKCKGVPVEDLCALVGGINDSNTLWVSAPDGYMMVFTYDQVKGDFVTFEPATLKELPHGELKTILMYEQDGALLSEDDGRPLRLAIVSEDKLLTEGHYWIKWVDKIAIRAIKNQNKT
ncbi:Oxidoreductase molybdopterin binding domain-containing protein [Candidatus Methanophagaceae archaeon]|nr:Oxidoreductase molybdopterin binding domain-containing protein [Methanophagales archaeon]